MTSVCQKCKKSPSQISERAIDVPNIINDALEYIATKTIEDSQETLVVPLNKMAKAIVEKYKDLEGDKLLPFISPQKCNVVIKAIFKKAGITRNVTCYNPRTEKKEKSPKHCRLNVRALRRQPSIQPL